MNIKTKFNRHQNVWTMQNNVPTEFKIEAIKVEEDYYGRNTSYCNTATPNVNSAHVVWHLEKECFASKVLLIKSL